MPSTPDATYGGRQFTGTIEDHPLSKPNSENTGRDIAAGGKLTDESEMDHAISSRANLDTCELEHSTGTYSSYRFMGYFSVIHYELWVCRT